jgi:hypothetical protein
LPLNKEKENFRMQTWARRGLQTALVTGGLLMLGTGIASAHENVNPDRPASPLDPQVKAPVRVHDNAIGTPWGQLNTPNVRRDITVSPDELTSKLPAGRATTLAKTALGKAKSAAGPVVGRLPDTTASRVPPKSNDVFRGNRANGSIAAPIEIAGNAVAAGGDANVNAKSSENDTYSAPVGTTGGDDVLAGNVVDLDWAAPVRVSGNAVGGVGKANTSFVSNNNTSSGGDIGTKGANGVLAGNVLSGQMATPAQVTANAVGAGGTAKSTSQFTDTTQAPGTITTNGDNGVAAGTGAGVPVALPAAVHGNSLSAAGKTLVEEKNTIVATAGQGDGRRANGDYISTSGKESVLSGSAVQPSVAGPVVLTCDALTAVGTADCLGGDTAHLTKAGGGTTTNGSKSVGGGGIAATPLATPVESFANSGGAGGLSSTQHHTTDMAIAGGDSTTNGSDAVLAGTNGHVPLSGPVEVFGNAGGVLSTTKAESADDVAAKAGGNTMSDAMNGVASGSLVSPSVAMPTDAFGQAGSVGGTAESAVNDHKTSKAGGEQKAHSDNAVASGTALAPSAAGPVQLLSNSGSVLGKGKTDVGNDVSTTAGGFTGTTGNDSTVSGNAVTTAVALPGEALGNDANGAGLTGSTVDENKTTTAGGATNTYDDAGVLSANGVAASLSGPAQLFGNAANGAGTSDAKATTHTTSTAGGPAVAKGTSGSGSGNITAVPVALPAQAFGLSGGAVGKSNAWASGDTSSTSGGDAATDGKNGTLTGNVVSLPAGSAGQAFGSAAGLAGNYYSTGANKVGSTAGGDVVSAGDDGSAAGNVASAQSLPLAQAFGLAAAGTGLVNGSAPNDTTVNSGGDITTSGDRGSIAGNLADVPVGTAVGGFGDAASVGGTATGVGPNKANAVTGGNNTTSGKGGNLSGNLATAPTGGIAQGFGNATSGAGNAVGIAPDSTKVGAGGDGHTSGEFGSLSGNLFAAPVAPAAQGFGNAFSGGGHASGIGPNETTQIVGGGGYGTDGSLSTLSGAHKTVPVGAGSQVFDIPVPVVAHALTAAPNKTNAQVDDTAPLVDLPVSTAGQPINKVPNLPARQLLPLQPQRRTDMPRSAPDVSNLNLTGLPNGVPGAGEFTKLPDADQITSGSALFFLDRSDLPTETLPALTAEQFLPRPRLG